jgi:hypothetical protein
MLLGCYEKSDSIRTRRMKMDASSQAPEKAAIADSPWRKCDHGTIAHRHPHFHLPGRAARADQNEDWLEEAFL